MTLDFPTDGTTEYTDTCGNEWRYSSTSNSWSILPPLLDIDVDNTAIWQRDANGVIKPVNTDDELNMGSQSSDIDFNSFPELI